MACPKDRNIDHLYGLTPDRLLPTVSFFTYGGLMKAIWRVLIALLAVVRSRSEAGSQGAHNIRLSWCAGTRNDRVCSGDGILSVICIKRVHRVHDLGEIVFCLCVPGLVLDCFEGGEEQADQDRNDCDDDEQLDESERAGVSGRGTHGANAKRKLSSPHVKLLKKLHRYKGFQPLLGKTTSINAVILLTFNSHPVRHLFRERALCAIGIVLHAKVFVDLEQPLLVRDSAQKFFPARIVSKKTRGSGFESPVR